MRPRVGHIQFLNCFPLFYGLIEKRVLLDVDLVKAAPTELNRLLMEDKLDIAPISSIAYARNHKELILIPDISVSCDGIVQSILLIAKKPVEELNRARIALSNTSATSQVLLKVLMAKKWGLSVDYFESPPDLPSMLLEADAALLIGDHALRADYLMKEKLFVYDLGKEWYDYNGHSMVFAVWAVRRDYAEAHQEQVTRVKNALLESMRFSLSNLPEVARKAAEWEVYSPEYLETYFSTLRFDFNAKQQAGLLAYYRAAHAIGELPSVPELSFLEV